MKVFEIIESQQKNHKDDAVFMVGEQLKDIAASDAFCAEILEKDLMIDEMNLENAEKKIKEYADEHRGKNAVFCVSSNMAEKILRKFYCLPDKSDEAEKVEDGSYIDLDEFLRMQ